MKVPGRAINKSSVPMANTELRETPNISVCPINEAVAIDLSGSSWQFLGLLNSVLPSKALLLLLNL